MSDSNLFLNNARVARKKLGVALDEFLLARKKLGSIHPIASDFVSLVAEYSKSGKAFRGIVVVRGYEWFGGADERLVQASYQVGAAIELLQTGLLIHDDIIDQDDVRRGKPSMHFQLKQYAEERGWSNAAHTGESLAIVVGDLCFFWLQELLTELDIPAETRLQLLHTFARESVHTGIGESVDIAVSVKPLEEVQINELEILNKYKTARYTVSLPLVLAAQLADVSATHYDTINRFGEVVGMIFQLRDDELGLFGSAEELGKPIGSDIREGKRTIWWCELVARCSEQDKTKLLPLSGKKELSLAEIEWVRELVVSSGTDEYIKQLITTMKAEAFKLMDSLPITEKHRPELEEAVHFIIDRKK